MWQNDPRILKSDPTELNYQKKSDPKNGKYDPKTLKSDPTELSYRKKVTPKIRNMTPKTKKVTPKRRKVALFVYILYITGIPAAFRWPDSRFLSGRAFCGTKCVSGKN